MGSERDRKIEARAYELWEQGGRQDGQADAHWAQASREIASDGKAKTSKPAPGKSDGSRPAAVKAKPAAAEAKSATAEPTGTARSASKKVAAASPPKSAAAKAPAAKSATATIKPAAIAKPSASARASAKT